MPKPRKTKTDILWEVGWYTFLVLTVYGSIWWSFLAQWL